MKFMLAWIVISILFIWAHARWHTHLRKQRQAEARSGFYDRRRKQRR